MPAFHGRNALLALIVTYALGTAEAAAQIQLFPSPSDSAPEPAATPVAPAETIIPVPDASTGIAVEDLGRVDAETVGALSDPTEALPEDLWTGLSRASVAALVQGLPARIEFPEARRLARRLLLSPAALPPADGGNPISVLRNRVDVLARLGFSRDAATLASVGTRALADEAGRLTLAQVQLRSDDLPGACTTAVAEAARSQAVFWQKLIAFCRAVAGQKEEAALAAQTLFDLGEEDSIYFGLMDSIALGLAPDLGDGHPDGALHYAMLVQADVALSDGLAAVADPSIAALAVRQSGDLTAAEDTARRGLLPPVLLAQRYSSEPFPKTALENPLETLESIDPAAGRALLYQVATRWNIPALKAEAIAATLDRSNRDGMALVIAPILADLAAEIPLTADLIWFAEVAARLFYVTGDLERAQPWHSLLRRAAPVDAVAAAGDARLWHFAVLTGQPAPTLARARAGWPDAIAAVAPTPATGAAHAAYLSALVQAATGGTPLDSDADLRARALAAPAETGRSAPALTLHLLDRAAAAGRIGETATLAVAALSAAPANQIAPSTVVATVRALTAVGLQGEARRLAIDAAVLLEPKG